MVNKTYETDRLIIRDWKNDDLEIVSGSETVVM